MPAFSLLSGSSQTRSTRILVIALFLIIVFLFLGNSQLTAGPYLGSTTDAELSPEHFANQHKQDANHGVPPADAVGKTPTLKDSGETKDQPSAEAVDDGYDHDVATEEPVEKVAEKVPDQDVWHDEKEDERLAAAPAEPAPSPSRIPTTVSAPLASTAPIQNGTDFDN
ncbi:hypothetical protein ACHAQA_004815 [Verticillium albo-atrum]